ncbi:MAG: electron transport complex subunit RsxB [Woeseiaceae bacterium]|nr:electron transport complex subunit RsxB [Woeseiaceae bacterium]
MWNAVVTLTVLALLAGLILGFAYRRRPGGSDELVDRVDALLPQTQCAQCGYPGCRPYARAIVAGEADINLCPPGGEATVRRLAELLARDPLPLVAGPVTPQRVAVIDEDLCIGCTHCRAACPVDAIVGAHQYMHTVIESECTGCELCVAPCPVDCITMREPA